MSEPTGYFSDKRCPRCGSTLLKNDVNQYWCSFVGGQTEKGCTWQSEGAIVSEDDWQSEVKTEERRKRFARLNELPKDIQAIVREWMLVWAENIVDDWKETAPEDQEDWDVETAYWFLQGEAE